MSAEQQAADVVVESSALYAPGCEPPEATEIPARFLDPPAVHAPAEPSPAAAPLSIVMAPIDKVRETELNHRKTFRGLEELAESIRSRGILQPLLARERGKNGSAHFELVFGARRLRGAKLAGLLEVPLMITQMSDREVLEAQLIENVQRENVDPIEEADGYRLLQEQHGYTVDQLALKLGKSKAYVYARLKLCELGVEGRQALGEGKLTASSALLVARVPLTLQPAAVKALVPIDNPNAFSNFERGGDHFRGESGDPIGAREALAIVQGKFMLRLADAPFDRGDATLVAAAGECSSCPKRTGHQPELFSDVKSPDTCTDPTCFNAKRDAAWLKQKAVAKAGGAEVFEGKRAKEIFPYPGSRVSRSSGFVDLDERDYADPKNRTFRERIGKRLDGVVVSLARDDQGRVHELIAEKQLKAVVPSTKGSTSIPARPAASRISSGELLKLGAEKAGRAKALAAIVDKVEKKDFDKATWLALVAWQLDSFMGEADEVLERRALNSSGMATGKDKSALQRLDVPKLRSLFVEVALAGCVEYPHAGNALDALCDALKVDVKQLIAKELARLKTEEKAPLKKKAAVAKKKGKK